MLEQDVNNQLNGDWFKGFKVISIDLKCDCPSQEIMTSLHILVIK
jgi:hypothetical protein